jgi:hypothetical protein
MTGDRRSIVIRFRLKVAGGEREGTEKVAIYQKRLFSKLKTTSFSLAYSGRLVESDFVQTILSASILSVKVPF